MSSILRSLRVVVKGDISDAQKSFKTLSKDMKNAGRDITAAGKTLTMGVTAPILGALAASVKFASDLEESTNKVNVAFKGSAGVVESWSDTTLRSFGIAKGTAMDMAATFGDMGTAMGQLPSTAAAMSTSLAGLAGDLASFKNIGIDQAATALRGIYTGEGEALKTLGIIMQDNTLIAYAQAEGYEKTYKEMSQAEKVALRYKYVMEATKNAQGDFARTSGGVANQLRIVQEGLKQAGASLGTQLLPYVAKGLKFFNELIEKFENLDDSTKGNIIRIGLFAAAIGPTLMVVGKLTSGFGLLAGKVSAALKVVSGGGGFLAGMKAMIGPQGIAMLAVAAIAAVTYGVMELTRESREASKETNALLDSVNSSKKAFEESTGDVLANAAAAGKLVDAISELNSKENKSNQEKQKLADLVAELNTLYPDMNVQIDEQTGIIDQNVGSLKRLIEEQKNLAIAQLEMDRWVQLQKENYELTNRQTIEQQRLMAAESKTFAKIVSAATPWGGIKLQSELKEANKAYDATTQALRDNVAEMALIEARMDSVASTVNDSAQQITTGTSKSAEEFTSAMTQSFTAVSDAAEESVERTGSAYAGMLDDFSDYRDEMEDSKKSHIDNMGALDDEGIEKTKLTAAKIKENLEKQIQDFQNWRASIQKLAARVPSEVMQELYNLGPSFAPVIADLNKMTDKDLASWVGVWQGRAAEAEQAAKDELGSFPDWMAEQARKAGYAWANGLDSTLAAIKAAARRATGAAAIGPVTYSSTTAGKLSTTVGMAAYATGTDYVPHTGPAILHKGEAVIPASENKGGRGSYNLTVNGASNPEQVAGIVVQRLRMAGAL